jgi:hypothetical protein
MNYLLLMMFVMVAVPAAAKVLAVSVTVYAVLQAAKQSDWVAQYLQGWVAIGFNVMLTAFGVVIVVPADQLYTLATVQNILIAVLMSSGIHGLGRSVGPKWLQGGQSSQPAAAK